MDRYANALKDGEPQNASDKEAALFTGFCIQEHTQKVKRKEIVGETSELATHNVMQNPFNNLARGLPGVDCDWSWSFKSRNIDTGYNCCNF